jgi:uncharacterized repeat protein (TIGR03803 family)
VVFKTSPTGKATVPHNLNGSDGASPSSGLLFDGQGNAYGTTYVGGASNSGVVYKLGKNGEFKVLYNFTGGADGGFPLAGLIQDSAGNLYGTTFNGGDVSCVFIRSLGRGGFFRSQRYRDRSHASSKTVHLAHA